MARKSNKQTFKAAEATPAARQATGAIQEFLANPNVAHTLRGSPAQVANWVASDYLRKMNPLERGPVMDWLHDHHPALHEIIHRDYPQYA